MLKPKVIKVNKPAPKFLKDIIEKQRQWIKMIQNKQHENRKN